MKVLHIITSLGSGGAEGMLYRLIKASNESVEHSVICLNKGGKYVSLLRKEGIDVLILNFNFISSLKAIILMIKFSRRKYKHGYQIITSWLLHADLVSWFVKLICGFNGLIWNIRNTKLQHGRPSFKNFILLKILSILSRFGVNRIISNSKTALEVHKKLGYKNENFTVIPNGFFIDKTKKLIKQHKHFNDIYRICIIARWHHMKDFTNLFQALSILRSSNIDFSLTIAGSQTGTKNKELVNLINKYKIGKYCYLLGEVDEVSDIFEKSHVTVLSSAYGEAFPNVLAESMLNFTPCIATDVGDAAKILDGVGLIVPIRDPKALSDALKKNLDVLRNQQVMYFNNCIKCFEKVCRNYDIQDIASSYKKLWKSLL